MNQPASTYPGTSPPESLDPPRADNSTPAPTIPRTTPAPFIDPAPNPAPIATHIAPPSPTTLNPPEPGLTIDTLDAQPQSPQTENTLYSVPYHTLFLRNFLAGFARALGGIILYLLFFLLMGYLSLTFLMPKLQPILGALQTITQTLPTTPSNFNSTPSFDPQTTNQLLQQFQEMKSTNNP